MSDEAPTSSPSAASASPRAKPQGAPAVAVGLCTYKRLKYLERALQHVHQTCTTWGSMVHVIVVDNDGTDPAVRETVGRLADRDALTVHFLVEPQPGIASARNAVFAKAEELGIRYLAMMDDDEWPAAGWLSELLSTCQRSGAVVVGGPVRPQFAESDAHLRRLARYWSVEPQLLEGKPLVYCTCNFLIDLQAIRAEPRPLFDAEFGLSGGEDVVFFRRLFYRGYPMAWCAQALMYEEVPPDRASLAWLRQRRFAGGLNAVRWERFQSARRALFKTLGLTVRLAFYPLLGREPGSRWLGWRLELEKVRGRYAAHLGRIPVQYRREEGASCR
jgi:succinoglycan biosynthesis protein ExoM